MANRLAFPRRIWRLSFGFGNSAGDERARPAILAGQSNYSDVRDPVTSLFVESFKPRQRVALHRRAKGGQFRPNDNVTRLAAAVALVRAAGLRSEAEAKAGTPLPFLDASGSPVNLRGYVSVAISGGLLQADTNFRPQAG